MISMDPNNIVFSNRATAIGFTNFVDIFLIEALSPSVGCSLFNK